jgi:hypothetical protein
VAEGELSSGQLASDPAWAIGWALRHGSVDGVRRVPEHGQLLRGRGRFRHSIRHSGAISDPLNLRRNVSGHEKALICRASSKWRDPDSNRGHLGARHADVPEYLARELGDRPASPHERGVWDRAAVRIELYRVSFAT